MADAIGKPNVSRTMAKPTSDKAQTPDGWKVARLGGVAEVGTGRHPKPLSIELLG